MPTREVTPLRGRARLRIDDPPRKIGSIIVPDNAQDDGRDRLKPRSGVVIALGPPALDKRGREIPWDCAVGDRVLYQFGQLTTDGTDAWVAHHEILGVLT